MAKVRTQSREICLQLLFQTEFNSQQELNKHLEVFRRAFDVAQEVWSYAQQLVMGVMENRAAIDAIIKDHSTNWSFERIALVELNLLRIAVFELKFSGDEVPPKVAINESIELAKKYASEHSSSFVNGILDQILKENT